MIGNGTSHEQQRMYYLDGENSTTGFATNSSDSPLYSSDSPL